MIIGSLTTTSSYRRLVLATIIIIIIVIIITIIIIIIMALTSMDEVSTLNVFTVGERGWRQVAVGGDFLINDVIIITITSSGR